VEQNIVYNVIEPFEDNFPAGRVAHKLNNSRSSVARFCPEMRGTPTFSTSIDLENHILTGLHNEEELPTKEDEYKAYYLEKLKSGALNANVFNRTNNTLPTDPKTSGAGNDFYKRGWALKTRKAPVLMSTKQKLFIYRTFQEGEKAGRKVSAETCLKTVIDQGPRW
jgi:hypothetical protein